MSDTADKTADPRKKKPRRSFASRFFRFSAISGLLLLLLLAGSVGFTETALFRSMLRDFITETVDSTLNARLTIESIDGNLFSGWKLNSVRLVNDEGSIVDIESIVLRYNLLRLPSKVADISELTLNAPRIVITKAEGRDWTINTLLRPSEDTDTSSGSFDWDIRVEQLRILDGELLVYDSTTQGPLRRDRLDAGHMKITKLNLALSARIKDDRKELSLNRFSWHNAFGDVSMKNMSGDIVLTSHGVSVKDLSLQTERTGIMFSAVVDSVDLLAGFDSEQLADLPMCAWSLRASISVTCNTSFLPSTSWAGQPRQPWMWKARCGGSTSRA